MDIESVRRSRIPFVSEVLRWSRSANDSEPLASTPEISAETDLFWRAALRSGLGAFFYDCAVSFAWRRGDVLMLDNMLVAHGRATFKGDRRVVVAMAQTASEQAHQTTSEASDAAGVHATAH